MNSRRSITLFVFMACILLLGTAAIYINHSSQATQTAAGQDRLLATVNGVTISGTQVQEASRKELDDLKLQKLKAEAEFTQRRYDILQSKLEQLVDDELLKAESAKRGVSKEELLKTEVDSKVQDPTKAEVDQFYQVNKARIRNSEEAVEPQIRAYLRRQKRQEAYQSFISHLKDQYSVKTFLKPFRRQVEVDGHPSKGPAGAPVTIVEFSDFQCPYCSKMANALKDVENHYGDKVRLVYRQFPISSLHPNAENAAEASLCAAEQGHFWDMYNLMFQDQQNLQISALKKKAAQIGLNTKQFDECLQSGKYKSQIQKDIEDGVRVGVTGTPGVFINGRPIPGLVPYKTLAKIIDEELEKNGQS